MQQQRNIKTKGTSSISLTESVLRNIDRIQQAKPFKIEIGGILAGCYESDGFLITDMTFPQHDDIHGRFRFIRKCSGHQELMDKLWKESKYKKSYLGEWHIHNQSNPEPSNIDICNWQRISRRACNFDTLFFMIIGTEKTKIWSVTQDSMKLITVLSKF